MKKIVIDQEKCKGCQLCVYYCPRGVLKLSAKFNQRGYHPVTTDCADEETDSTDKRECNSCGFCYLVCPEVCIEVYK